MKIEVAKISGISDFTEKEEKGRTIYYRGEKAFLVVNPNTIEVRCDAKLIGVLVEKYESVMMSRYFGKGGVEIVLSSQFEPSEIEDLIRLSYNLSIAKK